MSTTKVQSLFARWVVNGYVGDLHCYVAVLQRYHKEMAPREEIAVDIWPSLILARVLSA
jgi:hypothetical protein